MSPATPPALTHVAAPAVSSPGGGGGIWSRRREIALVCVMVIVWVIMSRAFQKIVFPEPRHFGGLDPLLVRAGARHALGGFLLQMTRVLQTIALVMVFVSFVVVAGDRWRAERALIPWLPFLALLWMSLLWVDAPGELFLRVGNMSAFVVAAVLIAANRDFVRVAYVTLGTIASASCVLSILLWMTGSRFVVFHNVATDITMFTGIFVHKGILSEVASIAVLYVWVRMTAWRVTPVLVLACGAIALYLAATVSSILGVIVAIACARNWRAGLLGLGLCALTMPVLAALLAPVSEALGKDPTMTGRTVIWAVTLQQIGPMEWIVGHGLTLMEDLEYWLAQSDLALFKDNLFAVRSAHNLWIELLYKMGIVGTVAMFWLLVIRPMFTKPDPDDWIDRFSILVVLYFTFKGALITSLIAPGASSLVYMIALNCLFACGPSRPPGAAAPFPAAVSAVSLPAGVSVAGGVR